MLYLGRREVGIPQKPRCSRDFKFIIGRAASQPLLRSLVSVASPIRNEYCTSFLFSLVILWCSCLAGLKEVYVLWTTLPLTEGVK